MDKKTNPDFTKDAHWGVGGRYVINAEGKRVPAPPVEEPPAAIPASGTNVAQNGPVPEVVPSTQVDSMSLSPAKFLAEADPAMLRKEKNRG